MAKLHFQRALFSVILLWTCFKSCSGQITPYSEENLPISADYIVQELVDKFADIEPQNFWQPYSHANAAVNREVVRVESVEKTFIVGKFIQWKYASLGFFPYLVGITERSIEVYDGGFRLLTSFKTSNSLVALTLYAQWDYYQNRRELIIPVATTRGIEVYKFVNGHISKINEWPLQYQIKALEFGHVQATNKLIVVPVEPGLPVDVYNIAINETSTEVWFHQRLSTDTNSDVISYDLGTESFIAISSTNEINVYTYDHERGQGQYTKHQTINLTAQSTQLIAFSIAYKHYLASVPGSGQDVEFFGYNGYQYVREDHLGDIDAVQIAALHVEDFRDDRVIIARQADGRIHVLSHDGTIFKEDYNCNSEVCETDANLDKGVGFIINGTSYFVLPTKASASRAELLIVRSFIQEFPSPLYSKTLNIIDEFSLLSERFSRWEGIVGNIKETLQDSLSLSSSNVISGKWTIELLRGSQILVSGVEENFNQEYLLGVPNIFRGFQFLETTWADQDFNIKHAVIDSKLNELRKLVYEANLILKDSIPLRSDDVYVVRAKQAVSGSFSTPSLVSDSIQVDAINYHNNVSQFLSTLVQKEDSIHIRGSVSFNGDLRINNLFTNQLNGILVSSIARLSQANVFSCSVQFNTLFGVNGNIEASRIGGYDLSEEILRVNDIQGVKLVDGLVALKEATVSSPIDSIYVSKETFENILLRTTTQRISAPFTFTDIESKGKLRINLLNGENFVDFANQVIQSDYQGLIRGQKTVRGSVSCESLRIDRRLNNYKFPEDLVFPSQRRLTISGRKNFTRLSASKVTVDGTIDGLLTTHLVSRLSYYDIKSTWRFKQSVQFLDDLIVKDLVDGIRMERLKHTDTLDQYKSSYYPDADIVFNQATSFKNLNVEFKINNQEFEDIFGGILLFDSREVSIGGVTRFKNSIVVDSLTVTSGVVNGVKLAELLTLNTAQNITGSKVFAGTVAFSSLYALSAFDTVQLAQLFENAFRLSKSRTISSKLSFEEFLCGSSMTVLGKINRFGDFDSVVAVTSGRETQVFETPIEFYGFEVNNLNISGNLQIENYKEIGGVNFDSWYNNRVSLSRDAQISVPVEIAGSVEALQGVNTKRINGVSLDYLNNGVLRSDRSEQVFLETFETSGLVRVNDGTVEFDREVSGFSINNIIRNAFPLFGSNTEVISNSWSFQSMVVTGDLTVNGNTCGVDLQKLDVDSVRKGESDVFIRGDTTFTNGIYVHRDLKVELVNSEDLFSSVLTLNTVQTVEGEYHFGGNVYVEELLSSNGYINDVSLELLANTYSFENGTTHVLKYDVASEGSLESSSLYVHKLVQGLDFKKYISNNIATLSSGVRVTGEKTFAQPISVQGDIDVYEVNGINVASLASSIVYKSDSVRFSSPVTFENSVDVPEINILYGDIRADGRVGEGNLTELIQDAVYTNSGRSAGSISFDSIVVNGNIDNVKYLNDIELQSIVTLDGSQALGTLNVKDAYLGGRNVDVHGLVQGYDLAYEYARTLLRTSYGTQVVTGFKEFDGNVYINGNLQCLGDLRSSLLTLNDRQTIYAKVRFTDLIRVIGNLEIRGLVDGFSLSTLVDEALTHGKAEMINGEWTFTEGVTFKKNVSGSSLLDGHEIGALVDDKKAEALTAEEGVRDELSEFEEKCRLLDALYAQVSESPVRLEFFENHQPALVLRTPVSKLISITAGGVTRIAMFSETCEISFLHWNTEIEQFINIPDKLRLGWINHWESVTHGDDGILVFTTLQSACSSAPAGLYGFTMDSRGSFQPAKIIREGEFAHVELVYNEVQQRTVLLAVGADQKTLSVYSLGSNLDFSLQLETQLSSQAERFEAISFLQGIAILYHSDYAVHMEHFNFGQNSLSSLGQIDFLAINSTIESPMIFFQNHHILYALLQIRNTLEAVIQPECSLQAFESYHGDLRMFQTLKSQALVSMSTIKFAQEVYVAALTKNAGVNIYRYMGLSGFELLPQSPIKVSHGVEMISFNLEIWNYNLPRPFIVISSGRTIQILHSNISGDLKEYEDLKNSVCKV